MMDREILIGGEESGGIGYGRFLPERDGILNALLLANVMAEEGKPLGQVGRRSATRIRRALLWSARSAHFRRVEERRGPARGRCAHDQTRSVCRFAQGGSRRRKVLPRRSEEWQWRRPVGVVSRLGDRTYAAGLRGGSHSRAGRQRFSRTPSASCNKASSCALPPGAMRANRANLPPDDSFGTFASGPPPKRDRITTTLRGS